MIYGSDRFIVKGYKQWDEFLELPKLQQECNAYVHLNNSFPLGTRIMQDYAGGICAHRIFPTLAPGRIRDYAVSRGTYYRGKGRRVVSAAEASRGYEGLFRRWLGITWRLAILPLARIGRDGRLCLSLLKENMARL
jgi:hypothetical protein